MRNNYYTATVNFAPATALVNYVKFDIERQKRKTALAALVENSEQWKQADADFKAWLHETKQVEAAREETLFNSLPESDKTVYRMGAGYFPEAVTSNEKFKQALSTFKDALDKNGTVNGQQIRDVAKAVSDVIGVPIRVRADKGQTLTETVFAGMRYTGWKVAKSGSEPVKPKARTLKGWEKQFAIWLYGQALNTALEDEADAQ